MYLCFRFIKESQERVDCYQSYTYLRAVADRWLGVRLQVIGSLIIFFAALFAVISQESINPGLAGLSISYTLEVCLLHQNFCILMWIKKIILRLVLDHSNLGLFGSSYIHSRNWHCSSGAYERVCWNRTSK